MYTSSLANSPPSGCQRASACHLPPICTIFFFTYSKIPQTGSKCLMKGSGVRGPFEKKVNMQSRHRFNTMNMVSPGWLHLQPQLEKKNTFIHPRQHADVTGDLLFRCSNKDQLSLYNYHKRHCKISLRFSLSTFSLDSTAGTVDTVRWVLMG